MLGYTTPTLTPATPLTGPSGAAFAAHGPSGAANAPQAAPAPSGPVQGTPAPPAAAGGGPVQGTPVVAGREGQHHVLIVEDVYMVRSLVRVILEQVALEGKLVIHEAGDGLVALEVCVCACGARPSGARGRGVRGGGRGGG